MGPCNHLMHHTRCYHNKRSPRHCRGCFHSMLHRLGILLHFQRGRANSICLLRRQNQPHNRRNLQGKVALCPACPLGQKYHCMECTFGMSPVQDNLNLCQMDRGHCMWQRLLQMLCHSRMIQLWNRVYIQSTVLRLDTQNSGHFHTEEYR